MFSVTWSYIQVLMNRYFSRYDGWWSFLRGSVSFRPGPISRLGEGGVWGVQGRLSLVAKLTFRSLELKIMLDRAGNMFVSIVCVYILVLINRCPCISCAELSCSLHFACVELVLLLAVLNCVDVSVCWVMCPNIGELCPDICWVVCPCIDCVELCVQILTVLSRVSIYWLCWTVCPCIDCVELCVHVLIVMSCLSMYQLCCVHMLVMCSILVVEFGVHIG